MTGTLYGIGVGPGDPQLMTLKAVNTIKGCDIIAIPAEDKSVCTAFKIAIQAVPDMENKPIIPVHIPMTRDKAVLNEAYNKGISVIKSYLDRGKSIGFLTLGDPTVYSTYMIFHEKILKEGYNAVIISGVPSFCAAAARLNISLGKRKENIHIFPAAYSTDEIENLDGTKILMKSGDKIGELKEKLSELEKEDRIKAGAVVNCGMENEEVYENINDLNENAGYFTTIIVKSK